MILELRGTASIFGPYQPPEARMPDRITPRQRELVELLREGKTIVGAARELGIGVATARHHIKQLALQLPNPHGLPALKLILSYFDSLPPRL